ncbi:MAG TPA: CBS domain-containing protein [Kofleriaceae bacterium]|nr:CBS domain-containing protein [Kofleriaceae bacterium]
MRARDLMSSPVITCHVNDSLATAAKHMWDRDCGVLGVVNDEGKLTGMITDRDICMAAYTRGRTLDDLVVNIAMSSHVVSAQADQEINELEELMATHQIRRIPIIDAHGTPIGMVSLNDLAIESAAPDSRIKQGLVKIAHTVAAICRPRTRKHAA